MLPNYTKKHWHDIEMTVDFDNFDNTPSPNDLIIDEQQQSDSDEPNNDNGSTKLNLTKEFGSQCQDFFQKEPKCLQDILLKEKIVPPKYQLLYSKEVNPDGQSINQSNHNRSLAKNNRSLNYLVLNDQNMLEKTELNLDEMTGHKIANYGQTFHAKASQAQSVEKMVEIPKAQINLTINSKKSSYCTLQSTSLQKDQQVTKSPGDYMDSSIPNSQTPLKSTNGNSESEVYKKILSHPRDFQIIESQKQVRRAKEIPTLHTSKVSESRAETISALQPLKAINSENIQLKYSSCYTSASSSQSLQRSSYTGQPMNLLLSAKKTSCSENKENKNFTAKTPELTSIAQNCLTNIPLLTYEQHWKDQLCRFRYAHEVQQLAQYNKDLEKEIHRRILYFQTLSNNQIEFQKRLAEQQNKSTPEVNKSNANVGSANKKRKGQQRNRHYIQRMITPKMYNSSNNNSHFNPYGPVPMDRPIIPHPRSSHFMLQPNMTIHHMTPSTSTEVIYPSHTMPTLHLINNQPMFFTHTGLNHNFANANCVNQLTNQHIIPSTTTPMVPLTMPTIHHINNQQNMFSTHAGLDQNFSNCYGNINSANQSPHVLEAPNNASLHKSSSKVVGKSLPDLTDNKI